MSLTRLLGFALLTAASASLVGAGLVACESATNLDVTYGDSSAALEGSAGDAAAGPLKPGAVLPGCPCDESQGLGCCMPAGDKAFCTTDVEVCNAAHGTFLKCQGPDPSTESVCCWRPDAKEGSLTALASACDGGVEACRGNGDCPAGKPCMMVTCAKGAITIGACGVMPECQEP